MDHNRTYLQQCSNRAFMGLYLNKSASGVKENWIEGAD